MDNLDNISNLDGYTSAIIKYLSLIFGNWINAYTNGDNVTNQVDKTVLTDLGAYSIYGAYILSIVLISFFFLSVHRYLLNQISKNGGNVTDVFSKDTVWLVKVAIVFVLLAPVTNMGISLSQRMVVYVALIGNKLADTTYNHTIDKMINPPAVSELPSNATGLALNILKAETCVLSIAEHDNLISKQMSTVADQPVYQASDALRGTYSGKVLKGIGQGGQYGNTAKKTKLVDSFNYPSTNLNKLEKIEFGAQSYGANLCGSIEFPIVEDDVSNVYTDIKKKVNIELKSATLALIKDISPIATILADHNRHNISELQDIKAINQNIKNGFVNAISNYAKSVEKLEKIKIDQNDRQSMIPFMKELGWSYSIVWIKMLADIKSSFISQVLSFTEIMTPKNPPVCPEQNNGFFANWWSSAKSTNCLNPDTAQSNEANMLFMQNQINEMISDSQLPENEKITSSMKSACNIDSCSWTAVNGLLSSSLQELLLNMTNSKDYVSAYENQNTDDIFTTANYSDPIADSVDIGTNLWFLQKSIEGVSFAVTVTTGIVDGTSDSGIGFFAGSGLGVISSILTYVNGHLSFAANALAGPAAIMSIVVPYTPILMVSILVLSYLVMVLLAFFSVPFGLAMWIVPDELFISTRVIQTVMMLTALLLRPFLYLISIVIAFSISYIAIIIFKTMFFWSIQTFSSSNYLTWLGLIWFFALGYTKIIFEVYLIIFRFADQALSWLGGGFGSDNFGSLPAVGNSVGASPPLPGSGAISKGISSARKAASEKREERAREIKQADQNTSSSMTRDHKE